MADKKKKGTDKGAPKKDAEKTAAPAEAKVIHYNVEPVGMSLKTDFGVIRKGKPHKIQAGSREHEFYKGRRDVILTAAPAGEK